MKTKKSKIIIGSRESKLAVLQSEMVRDYIKEKNPEMEVEILTMKPPEISFWTAPWTRLAERDFL